MNFRTRSKRQPRWVRSVSVGLAIFIAAELITGVVLGLRMAQTPDTVTTVTTTKKVVPQTGTPVVRSDIVLEGRSNIWDIDFLPNNELLFTERSGRLSLLPRGEARTLINITDVNAVGEGGLMGLAVDPAFAHNRRVYTCMSSRAGDIRVVRWVLNTELTSAGSRKDIVTGIPSNSSGRHSGCQLTFGSDGFLWIGTGDSAQTRTPQPPQDPKSLGGKILRVTTDGAAAPGNFSAPYDNRIYSYGHRNTQGLAFFTGQRGGMVGVSVEHGSDRDDELNPLKPGNFGWAPPDGAYNETNVPMTDKTKYPGSVDALWSSGSPTQAPSGVAVLGNTWRSWKGGVAISFLKAQHVKVLLLDAQLRVTSEQRLLDGTYGRLRAATLGPDGNLYVSSSNGNDDKIIRLTPQ